MGFLEIAILAALAAWIFFAVRTLKKKGGCCGGCGGCRGDCASCRSCEKQKRE